MKKPAFFLLILSILTSCSKTFLGDVPPNNPESVFENFCQQISDNYSGKDVRLVNWDSLQKVYRPKITAQTTENQLIEVFKAMILPYSDQHLNFKVRGNFISPSLLLTVLDYVDGKAVEKSLNTTLKAYKKLFDYGKTTDNIGYVRINTFGDDFFSSADYAFFDNILDELKDTKSLIIDVRTNSGGQENFAKMIAERFATTTQIYKYTRTKIGVSKDDYTVFAGYTLQPTGAFSYTNPVALLTGRFTYSTANNFVLMMRIQPNVTTYGNLTGDGVVGSLTRELPNGWLLQFPSGLAFLPDKTVIEGSGGIKPKKFVTISDDDQLAGRDAILEKALTDLR